MSVERLATEEELDSITIDVWSYKQDADGVFCETGRKTMTLREARDTNPGYRPLVTVRARNVRRIGNEPV